MKNREFDRLVSEIRNQEMDDDVIREAANRVLTSISGANVTSADPDARSLTCIIHEKGNGKDFVGVKQGL